MKGPIWFIVGMGVACAINGVLWSFEILMITPNILLLEAILLLGIQAAWTALVSSQKPKGGSL